MQNIRRSLPFQLCFFLSLLVTTGGCRRGPESYLATGNSLFGWGRYADAAFNYEKAIRLNGKYGEAYFRLGLVQLKLGDRTEAYRTLARAVELLPRREDVRIQFADLGLAFYLNMPQRPQFLYDRLTQV